MKTTTGKDKHGDYIVLHPETNRDYLHVGQLLNKIGNNTVWANKDGEFNVIQMKIYVDNIVLALTKDHRERGKHNVSD
jgi:hypothetical protein